MRHKPQQPFPVCKHLERVGRTNSLLPAAGGEEKEKREKMSTETQKINKQEKNRFQERADRIY